MNLLIFSKYFLSEKYKTLEKKIIMAPFSKGKFKVFRAEEALCLKVKFPFFSKQKN